MDVLLTMTFCVLSLAQDSLASTSQQPAFPAIFAFGDSLTDTGNLLIFKKYAVDQIEGYLPYGSNFFHKPTGRFSDGRLVVDFLAQRLRAPLLKPSLSLPQSGSSAFEDRFVNFAVAGATAQSAAFLKKSQNISTIVPLSLDIQLQWLKHFLEEANGLHFSKALVYFGEIGGNDYNFAFVSGKPYEEVLSSVSRVTAQVKKSLKKLIEDGARYIVVEGNAPLGCVPFYIQMLNSSRKDAFGCVRSINRISQKHNKQLLNAISDLMVKYPHVKMVFFDFEKAYTQILKRSLFYGFTNTTSSCYDVLKFANPSVPFNLRAFQEVKACPHPSKYISWDGVHLTEAMNKALTNLFFERGFVYAYPNFLTKRLD